MKNVVLSFDDGRLDTYENAIPMMMAFRLTATINITTDFVENPASYSNFQSAQNRAMTVEMVKSAYEKKFEIACHGDHHTNDSDDIVKGIAKLKQWNVISGNAGFASPFSALTRCNNDKILSMLSDGSLHYIRSGVQVRRQSIWYQAAYVIEELLHSKWLFYLLNRQRCMPSNDKLKFYQGVTVNKNTKLSQIRYLIEKLPDNCHVILILHSVLSPSDPGFGVDKWFSDLEMFRSLCEYLGKNEGIRVLTNEELTKVNEHV